MIVLKGSSPQNAFADTMHNELMEMSPDLHQKLLGILQKPSWHKKDRYDIIENQQDLMLHFEWTREAITLRALSGSLLTKSTTKLVSFVQTCCWLSMVMSISPSEMPAKAIVIQQKTEPPRRAKTNLHFRLEFLPFSEDEAQVCWLGLIPSAVLATTFLAPQRKDGFVGLEIPLDFMANICGARHAFEFRNGIVIKGFSVMLVPVKYDKDINIGMLDSYCAITFYLGCGTILSH